MYIYVHVHVYMYIVYTCMSHIFSIYMYMYMYIVYTCTCTSFSLQKHSVSHHYDFPNASSTALHNSDSEEEMVTGGKEGRWGEGGRGEVQMEGGRESESELEEQVSVVLAVYTYSVYILCAYHVCAQDYIMFVCLFSHTYTTHTHTHTHTAACSKES